MVKICLEILKKDPAAFLCGNPNCADCVMQRGKIKEAKLKEECFTLSAVSSEIVPRPEETFKILQGQGIKYIELDSVWNKKIIDLSLSEINTLKEKIESNKFSVSGIRSDLNRKDISEISFENVREEFWKYLKIGQLFKAKYIVTSSFYASQENKTFYRKELISLFKSMAEIASEKEITILVENEPDTFCAKSAECAEIIEAVNSPFFKIAFNPANFVRCGEKPFGKVPAHVRRMALVVYINDVLFSGEPHLPGYGNAEIKELISILRCWCFSGFFCLKPGCGTGKDVFNSAARSFWHLLETM